MADRWIAQGAKFLHLVDLDGARDGVPVNKAIIQTIAKKAPVPVQVGGGIRDLATIEEYLSAGVCRVILGTAASANPHFFQEACQKWPGRLAVDIAAKSGKVAVAGWTKDTDLLAVDLARRCEEMGAAVIVYTDIQRDGTQKGINLHDTREVARAVKIPLIASGGVSTLKDIEALLPLEGDGVIALIVGRALYAGTLKLQEAISRTGREGG